MARQIRVPAHLLRHRVAGYGCWTAQHRQHRHQIFSGQSVEDSQRKADYRDQNQFEEYSHCQLDPRIIQGIKAESAAHNNQCQWCDQAFDSAQRVVEEQREFQSGKTDQYPDDCTDEHWVLKDIQEDATGLDFMIRIDGKCHNRHNIIQGNDDRSLE